MKLRYAPLYAALILFAAILALSPEIYVPACFEGIALCAKCVLPALFPFMVITLLLIKTGGAEAMAAPFKRAGDFFGLPKEAAVIFIMSVFSGYPAGSRIVYEYCERGDITKEDAKKLAPMCSTSGPMFMIGSVGQNMFGDKAKGACLMCAHILSVLVLCLVICRLTKSMGNVNAARPLRADGGNALYDSFYSAVVSVIVAGGFICFFYTLSQAARNLNVFALPATLLRPLFGDGADALCCGLIEATGGCAALAAGTSIFALPLAGFLITFGGFSILAQQLCYLTKCGIKPVKFMAVKAAQGALCFVLLLPLIAT